MTNSRQFCGSEEATSEKKKQIEIEERTDFFQSEIVSKLEKEQVFIVVEEEEVKNTYI